MPLTQKQKKKEIAAIAEIKKRKKTLQRSVIRGIFSPKVVTNIMLGTRLEVSAINFMDNTVAFKLAE